MAFGCSPYHRVWHGWPLVISIMHSEKYKCFITATRVDRSLQLNNSAKAVGGASRFSFHPSTKQAPIHPSPPAKPGQDPNQVVALV
jgi:hypothetical protein